MKILHTSDWHLNDKLGSQSRQGDIVARLEEIAAYLEEHKVDVMVVAGDIFSDRYQRVEEWRQALEDVNRIFKPFLLSGGTIVAISGNHDNEAFFNLLRSSLDLAHPIDPQKSLTRPSGRLYLAAQPTRLLLKDKAGTQVQFVLMPYPTPERYLKGENSSYSSTGEKNVLLHNAMKQRLDKEVRKLNSQLQSVLVSHAHIRGSQMTKHNLFRLSEEDDVVFDAVDIPHHWAYAAFGHIHKAQALNGASHIRYSGSIEKLDYGERSDNKGVVLIEVEQGGRVREPEVLRLDATPIYRVEIINPDEDIPKLKDQNLYPEPQRALVDYSVIYKPGEHNRDAICGEVEQIFPRCYRRSVKAEGSLLSLSNLGAIAQSQDIPSTVRNYLRQQLANYPDGNAVLALYEQLLTEETAS
jgi:exonuclease SbcD